MDTPRDRNVETVSEGFSKPLSTELFSWLARNPPMPIVESTGEAAYHYPIPDYLKLKTDPRLVGHDLAIWWFIRLTDSPHRYRLARCFNQECAKYFVYSRNPRSSIKNGVFCVACAAVASMCRTRKSRDAKESAMLEAAADAWQRWKPTRTHPDQRAWVAKQINGTCGSDIKPKWVSQHLGKILEKVEAKRHAKG